jgi:FkbM family methyltransferase
MRLTPPPLYFMHLPRTGGTALGQWLRMTYGRHAYVDLQISRLPGMDAARLRNHTCYHSWHLGRGMFEWLSRPDLVCITLLRHPIERSVSDIYGIQRAALNHGQRFTASCLASLQPWLHASPDDCIRSGVMDRLLTNAQSRILGSRREYAFLQRAPSGLFWQPLNAVSWFDFPWLDERAPEVDSALHRDAVVWLDAMAVVGLTERFAESLLLIGDRLGIPIPTKLPHTNINPKRDGAAMRYRDQLSPLSIARLEELNRHDLELYDQARERFEEQWTRYQVQPRRTYSLAPHVRKISRPPNFLKQPVRAALHRGAAMNRYIAWFGVRQGLAVLWATLFAPDGEVRVKLQQVRTPLSLRVCTSDFRIYGQVLGRREYDIPLHHSPRTIIDAGANIGLTAIYFANRYPTARILAIEPEASNYAMLCKNVAAYSQIAPIRAALWDTHTMVTLAGAPGVFGAIRANPRKQKADDVALGQVETVTISQLMHDYHLDCVDVLKVDIEGAERVVFAAAASWIGHIGVIIAELHDRFEPGCTLTFNAATRIFPLEWRSGEHVVVARSGCVSLPSEAERNNIDA